MQNPIGIRFKDVWIGVTLLLAFACAPASFGQTTYHAFPCAHKSAKQLQSILVDILPNDSGSTHVVADDANGQILVRGSDSTLAMAAKILRNVDKPATATPSPQPSLESTARLGFRDTRDLPSSGRVSYGEVSPSRSALQDRIRRPEGAKAGTVPREATTVFLPIRNDTNELQARLLKVFAGRVFQIENGRSAYSLRLDSGIPIEFEFDARRRGVLVTGPSNLVPQIRILLNALQSKSSVEQRIAIVSIERSDAAKLRQAIDAYRGTTDRPKSNSVRQPATNSGASHYVNESGLALVNYIFQDNPSSSPDTESAPAQPIVKEPGGLDISVEVETLPDLDVIILQGNDRDVRKLTQIIQELERLSRETQPEVEIVPLQHAQSESVAEIVETVREDLTSRRQGRVNLTPLVKPNSILLIGWGEAIASTVELIRKLDTPVSPNTQFEVFRLSHATSQTIQGAISQFFGSRSGLGPRVQSFADVRSNSIVVYAAPRDMAEVKRLVESLDVTKSQVVNRARIFHLSNALATDLAQTLTEAINASAGTGAPTGLLELLTIDNEGRKMIQSGVLADVKITANPRNNTLIISGPNGSLPLIEALIGQLDAPGAVAQIKVFRVNNGDAASLVQMLRSLLPTSDGTGPQLPTAQGETSMAPLRFSVDTRTNSIIATGSDGDLEIIETLLLRLDEKDSSERMNEVYRLKNSPAVDVALAVNEFLRSERIVSLAAAGGGSAFEQIEREVVVVPEPVGNSLIISATPRYFDEIKELVNGLDAQPPQVMIQVLIAEIQLNDTHEFGIELGIQDSVLFDRSLLGDLVTTTNTSQNSTPAGIITATEELIRAATNQPGFNFNNQPLGNSGSNKALDSSGRVGGQGLSHFAVGRVNNELGFGGLVMSASSESVSVLIRALQESRRLDVLSRPQVRTLDNQPAFIQVGQRVPRIVATNLTEGGLQTNSVELENVGLIIGVTPRISPDGTVVMEIDAEKSSLGLEQDGIPITVSLDGSVIRSPRINTTTAQTTVSAASGETIIIGGLITKESQSVTRRVPYLSQIPLLGNAFRFDSTICRRNELLIILTPKIIRNPADSQQISQAEMARVSWCEADVFEMHGDLGLSAPPDVLHDQATEVIYPAVNPRGEPAPAPLPDDFSRPDAPADTQEQTRSEFPNADQEPPELPQQATRPIPPFSGTDRQATPLSPPTNHQDSQVRSVSAEETDFEKSPWSLR